MINTHTPRKRRDRLYIIAEILDIARDSALKTQIMYKANLSFSQLNTYLELLQETQLLKTIQKNGKTHYKTTQKGNQYMQNYKQILETLENNHNDNDKNNNNEPRIKGGPPLYWIKKP